MAIEWHQVGTLRDDPTGDPLDGQEVFHGYSRTGNIHQRYGIDVFDQRYATRFEAWPHPTLDFASQVQFPAGMQGIYTGSLTGDNISNQPWRKLGAGANTYDFLIELVPGNGTDGFLQQVVVSSPQEYNGSQQEFTRAALTFAGLPAVWDNRSREIEYSETTLGADYTILPGGGTVTGWSVSLLRTGVIYEASTVGSVTLQSNQVATIEYRLNGVAIASFSVSAPNQATTLPINGSVKFTLGAVDETFGVYASGDGSILTGSRLSVLG